MKAGNPKQTSESIKNKGLFILPIAAFGVLNLFIFIPVTLYKGNTAEFVTSFNSILPYLSTPALISFITLFIVGIVLPRSLRRRYGSIIFVLGLLLWLQGNIMNWKYGLFDGQGIEWSSGAWRGYLDITIWIVLLAASLIFHKKVYKIAPLASGALIVMQTAFLAQAYIQVPELSNNRISEFVLKDDVYEFSSKFNVIHVILDAFQSDIFEEIINENPDKYYNDFKGFTFFRETTGSFPTTYMSIPAIFSGKIYKNDIPMQDFTDQVMEGKNLPNLLYDKGYKVDRIHVIPSPNAYKKGSYTNFVPVAFPLGKINTRLNKKLLSAALMADLTLFRVTPHFTKKKIYNDQKWFLQSMVLKRSAEPEHALLWPFVGRAFLKDYISEMSINKERPVYKFIHITESHTPWVMNTNCEYVSKTREPIRERIKAQQRCALESFIAFIEKLKDLGIYDSSLIVLHGDHGANATVVKMKSLIKTPGGHILNKSGAIINRHHIHTAVRMAIPLLTIKPPFAKGPLKISNAQVELTDIPATILSLLDMEQIFDGRPAFEITPDETRERRFYLHPWWKENWQSDYLVYLNEFIIRGSIFDANSWSKGKVYFDPTTSLRATRKINFGIKKSFPHLYSGWSWNEKHPKKGYTFNWAMGRVASIFLSLPKNKPVVMTARIKSISSTSTQNITVRVDGKVLGTWKDVKSGLLSDRSVTIPPSKDRPKVSIIDFVFSHNRIPPKDSRPLAAAFESITISDINP